MSFLPSMRSELRGISATRPLRFRMLAGVVADLWHAKGQEGGGGSYISPHPRIVLFLDEGAEALRISGAGQEQSGVSALYIPAHLPIRSEMTGTRSFSHVDLHLEETALQRRLAGHLTGIDLRRPLFQTTSTQLAQLARMIAAEIDRPQRADLLLEGLVTATLAELFALPSTPSGQASSGLAPFQMAAVTRAMRANLDRRVSVAELAEAAGLSESWFARAFKATSGQTPHQWQMQVRIEAARAMLQTDPERPIAEIASACGFADQAHLSRAFRALTGQPPAVWRRGNLPDPRA